jgi:putative tryptophan/tyrosine transport system substrate-binding protein
MLSCARWMCRRDERMRIGRRDFVSFLGGALISLPRANAGQAQELPMVGFLHVAAVESYVSNATAFAQGLKDRGFAEAQNLAIEYRFANGHLDQLEALAADLAGRPLAVIVAGGAAAAMAAKAATSTIPIVLVSGSDPVSLGLAASLTRPGGNVTGVAFTTAGLMAKKLGLLRELVPRATTIGYLGEDAQAYASGSPISHAIGELKSEMLAAAGATGRQVIVAEIGTDHDYGAAFDTFVERRAGALVVAPSAVLANDVDEIIALAERHKIPAIFERRADVGGGGLISYGASRPEAWRRGGACVGQILKGADPAEMPVVQSAKLELTINLATAAMLGLTVPPALLAQADEVI